MNRKDWQEVGLFTLGQAIVWIPAAIFLHFYMKHHHDESMRKIMQHHEQQMEMIELRASNMISSAQHK